MNLTPTFIEGLFIAGTEPVSDARGSFSRFFCARDLEPVLGARKIAQINQSETQKAGAVRGLHFQFPPHAEMKMVRCTHGRVYDVAVDVRQGSKTFLRHFAMELSADNGRMLVIPEGFAHGFQVLEPGSRMLYLHTAFYHKPAEGGLRCDDPALGIDWPLPVADLSPRDCEHPLIGADFKGVPA